MAVQFIGYRFNSSFGPANENALARRAERLGKKQDGQMKNGSIFAGNMRKSNDSVMQRKKHAQAKALKIVRDTWAGDKKIDDGQEERKQRIKELQENNKQNTDIIKGYREYGEQLREQYNVAEDSQEQKDLELMLKADSGDLTEEERKRLAELSGTTLTEYQQRILDLEDSIEIYKEEIEAANDEIKDLSNIIKGVRQERLKQHNMVDAQKEADEMLKDAAKEAAYGMLMESKDHVEEEMEEQIEKAKEKKEKKEEQEEKLEEKKQEKAERQEALEEQRAENRLAREVREEKEKEARKQAREQEDLLQETLPYNSPSAIAPSKMKSEIKAMLQKMKLLEEDIKGAKVDDQI